MASYPPPSYPPAPGSPYGSGPRQQERFVRDQARAQAQAQKAAFQAQRELQRQQARSLRRRSILGPLLVLTIGIIALLVSIGKLPMVSLAFWYARWWPVVIVAAGLVLVAEWGIDQAGARNGTPIVSRGLGGGAVFLLILLIFLGLTARSIHGSNDFLTNGLSINPDNLDEIFGQRYDREQQIDQPLAPGSSLSVSNPHGDIVITGRSGDDKIHITLNKQVYSSSEDLANSKASRLSPSMNLSASVLNVSMPSLDGATADLSITIPESMQANVSADRGEVRIANMKAPVIITANRGDVQVDHVTGNIFAHLNSAHSSFSAHNVTGDVALKGRADDVNLADVSGQVTLEGEFFGDTHLERLTSPVVFHTSRTYLSLGSLPGQIDVSPESELSGNNVMGPTELRTRSRNISLQDLVGAVAISNTNGTVNLSHTLLGGSISVENRNGEVNLTVPAHAGFVIDAQTKDGRIQDEFALPAVSVGDRAELHASLGDGSNKLTVQTTHGDIFIHRQQPVAASPESSSPAKPIQKK